jgi:sugar lactone lactonase YvrE
MKTLFITTATARMTDDQLKAQPLAGSLFAVVPGTQGLVEASAV